MSDEHGVEAYEESGGGTSYRKEKLWKQANKKYKIDPDFYWITQTGDVMRPADMSTPHLFNALKMIWNNTVPKEFILQPFRKWGGIPQWKKEHKRKAVANLFLELMNRPDRTKGMNDILAAMASHSLKLFKKLPN